MPDKSTLRTLDLFTGVGGITHALRGFATPSMYCDIDPHAQAVLRDLMRRGKLPTAPIHADVTTLDGASLRGSIDMIVAGWPCVGMSSGGKKEGFANEQSGLYAHVVRLVREIRPPLLFMENVAPVVHLGLDDVLETLKKSGYDATWTVLYAYNAGAPHLRRRWFCLAYLPEAVGTRVRLSGPAFQPFLWGKEPVSRMAVRTMPFMLARQALLGNSVVPDIVRLAFCWLFLGGTVSGGDASFVEDMTLQRPATLGPFGPKHKRFNGTFVNGEVLRIEAPTDLRERPNLNLVLDPDVVPPPAKLNPLMTTGRLTAPRAMSTWATPRRSIVQGVRVLTNRCKQDLPTQLRFERSTPSDTRMGHVNPQWVEWLMGFDTDWTAVPEGTDLPKNRVDPNALSKNGEEPKKRVPKAIRNVIQKRQ